MEMQQKGPLYASSVPAQMLPQLQPASPTQSSSPTGPRASATSPDEPQNPPPPPALLGDALPPSSNVTPTQLPSAQAPMTLVPHTDVQEPKKITPVLRNHLILTLPSSQQGKLQQFWEKQKLDMESTVNFKSHAFPLSRVRRIMKSDDPRIRVGGEVPALISKACEIFISELTLGGWINAEKKHFSTLSLSDISEGTYYTDTYDFLVDILPWDRDIVLKEVHKRFVCSTRNKGYNGNGGTSNVIGCSSVMGGMYGMGASFPNPAMRQRTGMMIGPNSTGNGISTGGYVGMRYNNMPVAPTNLSPLIERREGSSSQSSRMAVHANYGTPLQQLRAP